MEPTETTEAKRSMYARGESKETKAGIGVNGEKNASEPVQASFGRARIGCAEERYVDSASKEPHAALTTLCTEHVCPCQAQARKTLSSVCPSLPKT